MNVFKLLTLTLPLAALGPAQASEAIIKQARCNACHALDQVRVGPSFKAIAKRYQGDKNAAARLAEKVRKGGSGVWGELAMTPNGPDKISDADLGAAVAWILAQN